MKIWFRNKKKLKDVTGLTDEEIKDMDWHEMPWHKKALDMFLFEALGPLVILAGLLIFFYSIHYLMGKI